MIEELKLWFSEHPMFTNIVKYAVWVIFIFLLLSWVKRILRRRLPDSSMKYKSEKGIEVLGYILIILVTITYFTGSIKDLGLAIGLLTAGITITLQELILSIAGSFYIFLLRVYKPGDRIEINGIKGDVIDIDSMYTTMMEIGEWVSGDNYSGRIVKLSNAFVFRGPVYNYSQDFPFVWDEFNIPIHYGSDIEEAKSIVITVAKEILSQYVQDSVTNWKTVVRKYYIENAQVDPTLAIKMTDNWIEFNLRYIVDYKKRRNTKSILNEEICKRIQATNGRVNLGSTTYEILKTPESNTSKKE